ncbi:hypothetical protein BDV35DRAFT_216757 [Aspergillus flavus]|uniref:Uncharacterized protein n=1 Tax=Aspergillus flavus TaxID=5059 RepID=A0A5N6GXX2_ASPFL|nr:hypothetical protein BDV35DRAFT_216757 [Aspergillus flavus]
MTQCPDIRLCDVAAGDLPFTSNGCSKIYISPHAGPLYSQVPGSKRQKTDNADTKTETLCIHSIFTPENSNTLS